MCLLVGLPATWGAPTVPNMPVPLGEVAAGKIGQSIYLVGEDQGDDDGPTLRYDGRVNDWVGEGGGVECTARGHVLCCVVRGWVGSLGGKVDLARSLT